jgi:hypothetical protein
MVATLVRDGRPCIEAGASDERSAGYHKRIATGADVR